RITTCGAWNHDPAASPCTPCSARSRRSRPRCTRTPCSWPPAATSTSCPSPAGPSPASSPPQEPSPCSRAGSWCRGAGRSWPGPGPCCCPWRPGSRQPVSRSPRSSSSPARGASPPTTTARPCRQTSRGRRVSRPAAAPPRAVPRPAHRRPRHGDDRLTGVTVAAPDAAGRVRPGSERHLPCDTLAVGHGMLAHTDLAEGLGCRLDGHTVAVDAEQRTDVPGVWAAGEATGIGGAALALAEGHIAGCSVAARLHGTEPAPAPAALKARTGLRRSAAALASAYAPPAHWPEQVTDDTVVCRCEEVTAGAVRDALDLGAGDARTVKLLTRAGMGWCQGRMCATAVAGLTGCPPTPSRRPFARPVPLGVLARHHPQEGLS
ncbi:LOW QUALITY PROTEIN: oxidase, partial [Streptomyces viridochromogenes DSM 40736]